MVSYFGAPLLAAGAATRGRNQAYEEVWVAGKAPRDVRAQQAASWASVGVGVAFAIAAGLAPIVGESSCTGSCTFALPAAGWVVGTLALTVALPFATHASGYRRRAEDSTILRARASRSGLGDRAYGVLGPPRRDGTARMVAGAAFATVGAVMYPTLIGRCDGCDEGILLMTLAPAAVIVGGIGLIASGAVARSRANLWRLDPPGVALASGFAGASLRGRF